MIRKYETHTVVGRHNKHGLVYIEQHDEEKEIMIVLACGGERYEVLASEVDYGKVAEPEIAHPS